MRWTLPKPSTGPQGGHGLLMTLHPNQSAQPNNAQAPVLPADRARGEELWNQVKGTAKEADFRSISKKHEQKNENRANYIAFLDDLKGMFVVPALHVPAPAPTQAPALEPALTPQQPAFDHDEGQAEPQTPSDGEDEAPTDSEDADLEGEDGREGDQPAASAPVTPEVTAPPAAPPVQSGLLAQLAGMLADGGEMTFQLMRVGKNLTIGVFPKPHPGEVGPQPLVLSASPDWLDAHLPEAIAAPGGYADARRDAFAVCQAAAAKQQAANKKAADAKASTKPAPPTKARTSTVTLGAAEGTTFTGKIGDQKVDLVIGENVVPQGTLEITATHPFYGESKKTLSIYAAKTHDFTEQQAARITVKVTPESAAVTATKDDTVLALHGETLLPTGSWLIRAEAADHSEQEQRLTVRPGKPQVIELVLKPEMTPGLF